MAKVYTARPDRFVRGAPKAGELPSSVWINKPVVTPNPATTTK